MSCVRMVLTVRPTQNSVLINLLGTEVSLTKTEVHTCLGFLQVYPGSVYIPSFQLNAQIHARRVLDELQPLDELTLDELTLD